MNLKIWQSHKTLLFIIFFVSGFSGLIYQSIWTHYLKLFLGHSAYAQTLVLAIFMGGMALGAWLCSRLSLRWSNLLVMYAAIEAIIGVAALLFHPLFVQVTDNAFSTVIPALDSPQQIQLYKWGLAALLVIPQSILLGMTFPLMSSGLIRLYPANSGGSIAMLYFTNSLGGAIGVLTSGFFIIKHLGLDGTIMLAGSINLLLALTVWWLFRQQPVSTQPEIEPSSASPAGPLRLMLAVALLTGTASFIYEIIWIRMLSMVLGSSSNAFELMLSAFIFGLAAGGLWIYRRIDQLSDIVNFLAKVQIIMGLSALATLPLYGQTFQLMHGLMAILQRDDGGFITFNLASHAIAMLIMFPTAFCAGMTLPLITHSLIKQGTGERAIGAVYGANTLGAIIGIIVAIHVGLPYFGIKGTLLTGALIDISLGLLLFGYCRRGMKPIRGLLLAASTLGTVIAVAFFIELSPSKMASGVYRSGTLLANDQRVLDFRDGKTATISVTASDNGVYSIRTNGKVDASIAMREGATPVYDEITMTLIAAIPALIYADATRVANIGFGSGMTSSVLLANPKLTVLDNIEIEPAVIAAAKAFSPVNNSVFSDPRSRIHVDDAKTFFSSNSKKYDIIISEPSNPWVSGVAGLFSIEFYRNTRRHLNDGGVLAQWLQVYEFDMPLLVSTLKAVASEFRHLTVYAVDHGDLLILASDEPIPDLVGESFSIPQLRPELERIGVESNQDLRLRWLGDRTFIEPLLDSYDTPANSDYFPFIDQNAARARFLGSDALDIFFPIDEVLPIRAILAQRELGQTTTRVSASPLATLAHAPNQATYLLARLLGQPSRAQRSTKELAASLAKADQLVRDCRVIPSHGDKVFLMYGIAAASLAYLHPDELAQLWSAVEAIACGQDLNGYEARWLKLFKAVSRRDTADMLQLSTQLLQQPQLLTPTRSKYLLGIGMLSLLATERHQEARQLWQNFPMDLDAIAADNIHLNYLRLKAHYDS